MITYVLEFHKSGCLGVFSSREKAIEGLEYYLGEDIKTTMKDFRDVRDSEIDCVFLTQYNEYVTIYEYVVDQI